MSVGTLEKVGVQRLEICMPLSWQQICRFLRRGIPDGSPKLVGLKTSQEDEQPFMYMRVRRFPVVRSEGDYILLGRKADDPNTRLAVHCTDFSNKRAILEIHPA